MLERKQLLGFITESSLKVLILCLVFLFIRFIIYMRYLCVRLEKCISMTGDKADTKEEGSDIPAKYYFTAIPPFPSFSCAGANPRGSIRSMNNFLIFLFLSFLFYLDYMN